MQIPNTVTMAVWTGPKSQLSNSFPDKNNLSSLARTMLGMLKWPKHRTRIQVSWLLYPSLPLSCHFTAL